MFVTTVLLIIVFVAVYYLIGICNESYWKQRGVKFYKKNKVLGPTGIFITSNRALFDVFDEIYKMYADEPAVGIGSLLTPALFVKDPVNLQHVLQSDFSSFNHRGFDINDGDRLGDNILFMNGNRWKLMRQSMTPLFSSAKIKGMFNVLNHSAIDFIDYLNKEPARLNEDIFNTLCTFCCAAISAAVFGIGTESIFDSPFLKMAQDSMTPLLKRNIQFAIASLNPTLFKYLGIKLFKDHESFFMAAIKEVVHQRERDGVKGHNFVDICMNLKSNGTLKDHSTGLEIHLTDELLAAQAFFFFVAGVEPSATAMFSLLVELGKNPDILDKIHKEIDTTFEKHNEITYDSVQQLKYLDMAYKEAMRMYPPIGFLTRGCTSDTVLPIGNITVEKGTRIFTPIFSIHHDPKLFEDPETFKPERFSSNNSIQDNLFMPFGRGYRLCIGMRFANLQVKLGLIHLLHNFTVKTHVFEGGIGYSKQQMQVRPNNLSMQLIPRRLIGKL